MQILAVAGVVAAFALVCAVVYRVGRSLQRRGRDLAFIDPHYPDSMQAVQPNLDISPPGSPYPHDDTSFTGHDDKRPPDVWPPEVLASAGAVQVIVGGFEPSCILRKSAAELSVGSSWACG